MAKLSSKRALSMVCLRQQIGILLIDGRQVKINTRPSLVMNSRYEQSLEIPKTPTQASRRRCANFNLVDIQRNVVKQGARNRTLRTARVRFDRSLLMSMRRRDCWSCVLQCHQSLLSPSLPPFFVTVTPETSPKSSCRLPGQVSAIFKQKAEPPHPYHKNTR